MIASRPRREVIDDGWNPFPTFLVYKMDREYICEEGHAVLRLEESRQEYARKT